MERNAKNSNASGRAVLRSCAAVVIIICAMLCVPAVWPGVADATGLAGSAAASTDISKATTTVRVAVSGPNTKITWKRVSGAAYYRVYRSDTRTGKKTVLKKKTTKLTFKDKKAKSYRTYYYHIRAYNSRSKTRVFTSRQFRTVMRVYVETGHGRGDDGAWDCGVVWKGQQEAKLVIPIAKAMCDSLRKNGIYVYTDAYGNNNRNLNYTLRFLKTHSLSAFVNIHCDSPKEGAGTWTLYRTSTQKAFGAALNKGVHEYVKISDRGLKHRRDLRSLKQTDVPATCLYESGNIKKDNKLLNEQPQKIGKGLAKGLCDYFGIRFKK